VKFQILC